MRVFSSELFFGHHLPGHAECPGRLEPLLRSESGLQRVCAGSWLADSLSHTVAGDFFNRYVSAAHAPEVLTHIKALLDSGGQLDADTYVRPDSLAVAMEAIACAYAAAESSLGLNGEKPQPALAVVRPPGHHATQDQSMGFCLFNTIAVVAKRLRREHGIGRILIVDFDVHHGNGSQDIFYRDDSIFFYSIHRFPFYPGTGAADETGTGKGLGYTLNAPMAADTQPEQFLATLRHGVQQAADKIKPELIMVSAGFDAHRDDPVGGLGLGSEDYETVAGIIAEVAQHYCGGRVVSMLEGGYNPQRLAESIGYYARGF